MIRRYDRYKNIPFSLIIKKDLRKRNMSQKHLANLIGMSYSSLNKVLNGHAYFNVIQAASIDRFFGYEDSFIFRLQIIDKAKSLENHKHITSFCLNVPSIRPCVFWDTDVQSLDWIRHRIFIEQRILSHGNPEEKLAMKNFYDSLK